MSSKRSRRTQHRSSPLPRPSRIEFAEEDERLAEHHPEQRVELLLESAATWSDEGRHDRALALYERLMDDGGDDPAGDPDLVDAYRINTLWDAGRDEEAAAAVAAFHGRHPWHAGAWNLVAEGFEVRHEITTAAEWFTAGVTHALGAVGTLTADLVEEHPQSYDVETLLTGRHRVRRQLGEPHDDWDDVADSLHERRASTNPHQFRPPLDEQHDPVRRKRMEEHAHEIFEQEFGTALERVPEERRAGPGAICVLHWPRNEFAELLERWPGTREEYGDDHAEHVRQVERTLRERSDEGATRLAVGRAAAKNLELFAIVHGGSPEVADTRSGYAAQLVRTGRAQTWPPPRNAPCWCASGRKYKKCCGNPAGPSGL